jgi:hypothetical protein
MRKLFKRSLMLEFPQIEENEEAASDDDDDDFNPKAGTKKKAKGKPAKESMVEIARQGVHTLNEHHEHLIPASLEKSFEVTFGSGPGGIDLSSSQIDGGFVFDDNFLGTSDGFDLAGGLGDELAKELGWEINETRADAV